jgi:hypothetical protein
VRAVLRGIRRTIGAARDGKAPGTADVLKQMLALCPDTLVAGNWGRALLALGFAGAFPIRAGVALQVEDMAETPDGRRWCRISRGGRRPRGRRRSPASLLKDGPMILLFEERHLRCMIDAALRPNV